MLRCKTVARTLAETNYKDLTPFKQFRLRLHVALCALCRPFHRQLIAFHLCERRFREREDAGQTLQTQTLSPEARERARRACSKAITERQTPHV
jgi:hypothetical protein